MSPPILPPLDPSIFNPLFNDGEFQYLLYVVLARRCPSETFIDHRRPALKPFYDPDFILRRMQPASIRTTIYRAYLGDYKVFLPSSVDDDGDSSLVRLMLTFAVDYTHREIQFDHRGMVHPGYVFHRRWRYAGDGQWVEDRRVMSMTTIFDPSDKSNNISDTLTIQCMTDPESEDSGYHS